MKSRIHLALAALPLLAALAISLGCNCLCGDVSAPPPLAKPAKPAAFQPGQPWHFVVSGDSRNCGDVVMPAIAQGAAQNQAQFYWHLGDLRAIYDFDQDMQKIAERQDKKLTISDYESQAWPDFRQNQIVPFGGIPFFLGIGNHETIGPFKTRADFITEFADYLDMPEIKRQRLKDNPKDTQPHTYYHWIMDGADFIYLDNASHDQFDAAQMTWLEGTVFKHDAADSSIRALVVGMHAALPNSISAGHSMNEWPDGIKTGAQVYQDLLKLQNDQHKKVYVLASHSHYVMENTYNTQYWRSHGGVLPGWIVGTAGAVRYPLPEPNNAALAKTNVYGYLLATVNPSSQPVGTISFEFKELKERDVPPAIIHGYTREFVHWCFAQNSQAKGE
ncbi:MAG TPA: hypothetical protein VLV49_10095 [Terriglobales bacterium]|nr:hypothetical protein [Terriglobales bacterium]